MSIQRKLNLAVMTFLIFCIFLCAHNVSAFSDLNSNSVDDSTEDEVIVTSEQNLAPGEYNFNNLTIKSGVYVNILGDHSAEEQIGVKIIAKNIIIESGAILYGMGSGYCSGPLTQFCNGGKLIIESENLILDGGISEEGHFAASGGAIFINTDSFSGVGAISVQGGKRYCTATCLPPGKGGHIEIKYNESTWAGQAIASAGLFCDSGGCYPMGENGYATIFKSSNNDLLVVGDYVFTFPDNLRTLTISSGSNMYLRGGSTNTIDTLNVNPLAHLYLEENSKTTINTLNVLGNFDTEDQATLHVLANSLDSINILNITGIVVLNTDHTLSIDTVNIEEKGNLTSEALNNLKLDVNKINIASTASVSTEGRGECNGAYSTSLRRQYCASTSIDINVKDLVNNGIISSRGEHSTNSGNINIKVDKISGTGMITSKGGMRVCGGACIGPGNGGDITVRYKDKSGWSGTFNVDGGDPDGVPGVLVFADQCDPEAPSNIMFLPGMMASRLYEDGNEVWFSASSSMQTKMSLNAHGKDDSPYVYTKDDTTYDGKDETGILDEVEFAGGAINPNIYKSFIRDLQDWKEKEKIINDYAFIPYDWRLSLDDIVNNGAVADGNLFYGPTTAGGKYIIHKLEDLAANSNSCRVTIIAHSNGGLVAKYLIHQLQAENPALSSKIDKLILVASPQIGTPESMVSILHGVSMAYGFIMTSTMSRDLSENLPVVYNLLPSNAYFQSVDTTQNPLINFNDADLFEQDIKLYGASIDTEAELSEYLLGADGRTKPAPDDLHNPNIGNQELYENAKSMHAVLDNWRPPENLKVIQVAGWGEETISNLEYRNYANRVCVLGICKNIGKPSYKINKVVDGDATVVEPSALWMSPVNNSNTERWWVDLYGYNKPLFKHNEHKNILEVSNLRKFIKAKILGSDFTDSENIVVPSKPNTVQGARLHFQLHSPLYLGIVDAEGRYTGIDSTTGEIKQEIPDTTFEQVGEVQFLSVPYGVEFTLKLHGYDAGSFALDVDKVMGNEMLDSISFEALPATDATLATMDIGADFSVGASVLRVDVDGDGKIDITVSPNNEERVIYEDKNIESPAPIPAPVASVVNIFANLNVANKINNADLGVAINALPETVDNIVYDNSQPGATDITQLDTEPVTYNGIDISDAETPTTSKPVIDEPNNVIQDRAALALEAAAVSGFNLDSDLAFMVLVIIILIILGFKFIKK